MLGINGKTTVATAGCVTVALWLRPTHTGEVQIQKARTRSFLGLRALALQAFVGLPITGKSDDAGEQLLRALYAICPEAHVAAWRLASHAVLGSEMSAFERETLHQRVAFEAALGHLRLLTLDLPRALNLPSSATVPFLTQLQGRTGLTVADEACLIAAVEEGVTSAVLECVPQIPSSEALYAWVQGKQSLCAQMLQALYREMSLTRHESRENLWHALLLARINDLLAVARALKSGLRLPSRLKLLEHTKNSATVQVATARGALRWRLVAAGAPQSSGHALNVSHLTIEAPTDRNFVSGGLAERLLTGLRAPDEATLRRRVATLVAILDPCTESVIQIHYEEATDA